MRIQSYNKVNNHYEFYNTGGEIVDRFYLPDTFLSKPAMGYVHGVVISEDNNLHRRNISSQELVNMGFTSYTQFITQFNTDKSNSLGSGGSASQIVNVLDDETVSGDGVTDDTTAINAIITANSGKILFFEDATYLAHITIGVDTTIIAEKGATMIWSSTADPVVTINSSAKVNISDMFFNSTHASGKGIDNDSSDSVISNCHFRGFQNDATGILNNETNIYNNCTFEIHTADSSDLGSLCWSANAIFRGCIFTGNLGADVQDSSFYNCRFGDDKGSTYWGVHMPLGAFDNSGNATAFSGNAKFYQCVFFAGDNALTDTYACGLGNAAHPTFYYCSFIGRLYGLYVRSESTVECHNCYFRAKMTTGGASSLIFVKYNPGGWGPGIDGEGDSFIYGGSIQSAVYSLTVPDSSSLGSVTLNGVDLEWDKLLAVDAGGTPQPHNEAFLYITEVTAYPDSLFEQIAVTAGDQVIDPPYTPSGVMFVELANNAAGTRNVRLTKFYRNPDGFYRNGTILILRGVSDTNLVRVKNGYWAAETTLTVNSGNADIVLGNGDVAAYIYYTNTWHELTNFNLSSAMSVDSDQLILGANSRFVFTSRSTIPSPATNVLYLDDGTNHGLGGTPTLMFHNGVGWNALF